MASAVIHMAVAKRVNEVLNLDNERAFLFGAVAPDIAKMVGSQRYISHFANPVDGVPDLDRFLARYKEYLVNEYELGYFVHLATDVLWSNEFLPNFVTDDCIIDKKGEKLRFPEEEISEIIYNDYSNMNAQLLSYYNFDLSLYYQDFEFPENHIKEVNEVYFPMVIKKLGDISTYTKEYSYLFNIESIVHFIEFATIYCLDEIKKIEI